MKNKKRFGHDLSLHLRGIRELRRVSPRFFPILSLYCLLNAGIP